MTLRSRFANEAFMAGLREASPSSPGSAAAAWGPSVGTVHQAVVYCYRGDATNQEAIEKSKVHLSEVCTIVLPESSIVDDFAAGSELCDLQFPYNRFVPNLQIVKHGTGAELYNIVLRQFREAGCAHWMAAPSEWVNIYSFVWDQGSENQACSKKIASYVASYLHVWCVFVFCFFHQWQLIIGPYIKLLESWEWTTPDMSVPYYSALATICNTWRSVGNPNRIYLSVCGQFGDAAGLLYAKKLPGRAVRSRWGSIDAVERVLDNGRHVLAWAFGKLWDAMANNKTPARRPRVPGPGADVEEEERAKRKRYTEVSAKHMGSQLFQAVLRISLIGKGPLMHWFFWAQKRRGIMIAERKKVRFEKNFSASGPRQ